MGSDYNLLNALENAEDDWVRSLHVHKGPGSADLWVRVVVSHSVLFEQMFASLCQMGVHMQEL